MLAARRGSLLICDSAAEQVRDIPNGVNIPMTIGHYLRSMGQLTNQFTHENYRDPKRQRLYLKDIDCPDAWADHLKSTIPECVYYLNDCIESRTGGDGAIREPNEYGQMRFGKGVAPAGDLMSSLPPAMRAQNMMCYVGHEGTYTATHREMCASLGHNIMVEASKNGRDEKEGSSVWFMTETKEREVVSEYFLSMLGHDIEVEKHFAQVNAWRKAPFNVWVVEQKVGDLILIPPLAPHQVWNRGTRTVKAAWNRTTVDTLELAMHEAIPRARMVCREEQYKCKAIIYFTLVNYYDLLQRDTIEPKMWKYGRIKQLLEDFRRLFSLFQEMLVSEMFSPKLPEETNVEMLPYDSFITCSYCRCNIFNRFLTCKSCVLYGPKGEEDTYDICMDCYAMGRSCACISALDWAEQWDWNILVGNYEAWRGVVVQFDGFFDTMRSQQVLETARKRYGKKPITEVCQEQLKRRPWTDITKPKEPTPDLSEEEPEVDDEGRIKVRKGKKGKPGRNSRGRLLPAKDKTHACHICCHQEWNWKLADCTTCSLAYCYGTLWRAFDMMPQTVMEDKDWQCPRCLKMCSCSKCRKGDVQKPYQPRGTLLGHDTKRVADYRSVESLVDFSKTNLGWLRDENADNPQESGRMKRLKEKAQAEKARVNTVDDSYLENGAGDDPFAQSAMIDDHERQMEDIDPSLRGPGPAILQTNGNGNGNGEYRTPYDPPLFTSANPDDFALNRNMGDDIQNAWMDGHYDLDDHDSMKPQVNQQPASYPSRLLAPVAAIMAASPAPPSAPATSMEVPEQDYLDPSHVGQNRMMGIGYYQQGSGIDRILYDPPNATDTVEDPSQPPTLSQNPNLALSDLLDPSSQQPEVKKRKKSGFSGSDEEEEFFTSKKQKLALTKKQKVDPDEVAYAPPGEKRAPRRSTGMTQTYIDLGEDAVPIEEDEAETIPAYPRKKKAGSPKDDLELAAQAMNRFSKPKGRRGRPKGSKNTINTPQKSAWLNRKEDVEIPEEEEESNGKLPAKRARRPPGRPSNGTKRLESPSVEITSGSDSEGGGAAVNYSDIDSGKDSLFGEPLRQDIGADKDSITWRPSKDNPSVKVAERASRAARRSSVDDAAGDEDGSDFAVESPMPTPKRRGRPSAVQQANDSDVDSQPKSTPKRRGRPPKNSSAGPPAELRSPSPPRHVAHKLLSLKEKLALKGKGFKIVSSKPPPPELTSGPSSPRSTPAVVVGSVSTPVTTTMPRSILKEPTPSAGSLAGWTPTVIKKAYDAETISRNSSSVSFAEPASGKSTPAPAPPPLPARKGPTVVRLESPDSESEEDALPLSSESEDEVAERESSDDDIPAVLSPKTVRGNGMAVRERGRPAGNTARRGGASIA